MSTFQPQIRSLPSPVRRTALASFSATSVAQVGLFVLAIFYTLHLAQAVLLPLVLALLLAALLRPLVCLLQRARLSANVSVLLVLGFLLGVTGAVAIEISAHAASWSEELASSLQQVDSKLQVLQQPLARMNRITQEIERLSKRLSPVDSTIIEIGRRGVLPAIFAQTRHVLGTFGVVLVLLYFFLASGQTVLRKIIRQLPSFHSRRRAVRMSQHIQKDLSHYLLTITIINVSLGTCLALAYYVVGLPNPVLWGVLLAALNFVPYLGPLIGISAVGVASALAFPGFGPPMLITLGTALLTGLEGYVLTPLILGHRLRLNPLIIFLSLLFWGWMWGIAGALLAVPIVMSLKIFCHHVDSLEPVANMLGR